MAGVELVATRFAETRLNGHTSSDDRFKVSQGVIYKKRLNKSSFSSEQTKHSLVARLPRLKVGADCRLSILIMYFTNMIIMNVIIVSRLHTDVN